MSPGIPRTAYSVEFREKFAKDLRIAGHLYRGVCWLYLRNIRERPIRTSTPNSMWP